jgi:hypothetical protein
MRMKLDQMMKEFAQTPGAPRASNVTRRGLGCCDTASRTEPTTPNGRHTRCPRFAWRAQSINVALHKALLEDFAELHLAGTALERAASVPLKACATLRTMKLRHGCRLTPQFSGGALPYEARRTCIMKWRMCGAPAPTFHRPLQLLVRRLAQRSSLHWAGPSFNSAAPSCDHVGASIASAHASNGGGEPLPRQPRRAYASHATSPTAELLAATLRGRTRRPRTLSPAGDSISR